MVHARRMHRDPVRGNSGGGEGWKLPRLRGDGRICWRIKGLRGSGTETPNSYEGEGGRRKSPRVVRLG